MRLEHFLLDLHAHSRPLLIQLALDEEVGLNLLGSDLIGTVPIDEDLLLLTKLVLLYGTPSEVTYY
jgi:hypothetical protein